MAVVAAAELDPHACRTGCRARRGSPRSRSGRHLVERGELLDRAAGLVHVATRARASTTRGPGRPAAPAAPRRRRRGRTCGRGTARPSARPARRRRGSRRCAGGRRTTDRGCRGRPRATPRRSSPCHRLSGRGRARPGVLHAQPARSARSLTRRSRPRPGRLALGGVALGALAASAAAVSSALLVHDAGVGLGLGQLGLELPRRSAPG